MNEDTVVKTPTPALDFRKMREEGALITFPSARVMRVRHTNPEVYLDGLAQTPPMFQQLIRRMLVEGTAHELASEFMSTERTEINDVEDFMVSLNIVCSEAMISPWIPRPTPRQSAMMTMGIANSAGKWTMDSFAAWRAPDKRNLAEQITVEDVSFIDKCNIFMLAFIDPIWLYIYEAEGLPVVTPEQAEEALAESTATVSESVPAE